MTMMAIAICDDMQVDARRLHKQLERIVPGSEIRIFKSGELLLEELEKKKYDCEFTAVQADNDINTLKFMLYKANREKVNKEKV